MKAAIYTRVSREEQTKGLSLETQETDARTYAEAHGHTVIKVYSDPGVSGAKAERPGLNQLIADAEVGLFDVVLVRHVDRLSRDAGFALQLSKQLKADIIPFAEGDSTSEDDRFFFGLRALVAEEERKRTRERMMRGKKAAAAKGKWHGGEPPYGTKPEPHTEGGSVLVVNEEEAKVIRDIYAWMVDEGMGPYQVAQRLNEGGVKTRRGKQWSRQLLKFMLRNPRLMGTAHWWGEEVEIPRLLTKAEWVRLQSIFEANSRKNRNTGHKHSYPLSGRLFDPLGHHWIGGYRKEHRYYHCSQHPSCDWRVRRWIRADELEQLVVQGLQNRIPRDLTRNAAKRLAKDINPAEVEKARARVESLEDKLGNLYLQGADLDPGALKKATAALEIELNHERTLLVDLETIWLQQDVLNEWAQEMVKRADDTITSGDIEEMVTMMAVKVDLRAYDRPEGYALEIDLDPSSEVIRERFT